MLFECCDFGFCHTLIDLVNHLRKKYQRTHDAEWTSVLASQFNRNIAKTEFGFIEKTAIKQNKTKFLQKAFGEYKKHLKKDVTTPHRQDPVEKN